MFAAIFPHTSANAMRQLGIFLQFILVAQHLPQVSAQPGTPQTSRLPTTP